MHEPNLFECMDMPIGQRTFTNRRNSSASPTNWGSRRLTATVRFSELAPGDVSVAFSTVANAPLPIVFCTVNHKSMRLRSTLRAPRHV